MTSRHSPPVLPEAPADLIAVAPSGRQVILAWNEYGAVGLGFRIERAYDGGSASQFSEIGKVGSHVTAFCDVSVKPCMTYFYRILAWNASGNSSPSNVVEVTTPQAETGPQADQE